MLAPSPTPVELFVTLHGANGAYVRALAVLYASIRTHTSLPLQFWIIHDDTVPAGELATLSSFIAERDAIRLVDVREHPDVERVGREFGGPPYSPAVIWRVFAADLVGASKAILLDADLIFLSDVAALWNVDIGRAPLAASLRGRPWPAEYHELVRTPPDRYFRMGVSVLNLEHLRADEAFRASRVEFLRTKLPAINAVAPLQEQSLFNYYYSHSAVPLDINLCPVAHFNTADDGAVQMILARMGRLANLILDVKGWQHRSPFDYFYWSYLLMTPWRDEAYRELARHQRAASESGGSQAG